MYTQLESQFIIQKNAFNGYTLFNAPEVGTVLIDMNGGEVKIWDKLRGFPNKLMNGGYVFGHSGERDEKIWLSG